MVKQIYQSYLPVYRKLNVSTKFGQKYDKWTDFTSFLKSPAPSATSFIFSATQRAPRERVLSLICQRFA